MPLPAYFHGELIRWRSLCTQQQDDLLLIITILKQHTYAKFFPNTQELCKVLCIIPVGSMEAQRSFSCMRHMNNWPRNSTLTDLYGDLAVITMHGHKKQIYTMSIGASTLIG